MAKRAESHKTQQEMNSEWPIGIKPDVCKRSMRAGGRLFFAICRAKDHNTEYGSFCPSGCINLSTGCTCGIKSRRDCMRHTQTVSAAGRNGFSIPPEKFKVWPAAMHRIFQRKIRSRSSFHFVLSFAAQTGAAVWYKEAS